MPVISDQGNFDTNAFLFSSEKLLNQQIRQSNSKRCVKY